MATTDLRYPVGKFLSEPRLTSKMRQRYMGQIAEAPMALAQAVKGLTAKQFDTPYRPEGWAVRQVVHHLPESHMNSYIRCKLALIEDEPTIKLYDEQLWASSLTYGRLRWKFR